MEDWTEGLDRVGYHWDHHLVVAKLIRLAVIQEDHTNVPVGRKTDLHS